jgi:DNA-binding transcriptional regulator YbjK
MPKKASYHHGNLRAALLAAALDILETDGLHALTLRKPLRRITFPI